MGSKKFGSYRAFSGHRTGGGGNKYLRKWKEKGTFDSWMHVEQAPIAIWRHGLPQVVIVEDKKGGKDPVRHVWTKPFVCWESENVLTQQYFRHKDSDERKIPPKRCGLCKLIEWCYQQAFLFEETRGKKKPEGLNFTTPIFKFEADDPKESCTMHVGGICKIFEKLSTDVQKQELKEAGIAVGGEHGAWRENGYAKCSYAITVVNNDQPVDGVQIAVETSGLGDKIKEVIEKTEKSLDRAYDQEPYCIQWTYDKNEKVFSKMYDAIPLLKIKPTPRIMNLIRGEAPDLSELTEFFNQQTMRAVLEKHCVLPKGTIPWDDLFPTKDQEKKWREERDEDEEIEDDGGTSHKDAVDEATEAAGVDDEPCDDCKAKNVKCPHALCDCGKTMLQTDPKCAHCGKEYKVTTEPDPAPPPRKMKSRSSVGGGTGKPKQPEADLVDDEIPF